MRHSLIRSLIRSHRSLVCLLRTARFAGALCCAHSFARSLTVYLKIPEWRISKRKRKQKNERKNDRNIQMASKKASTQCEQNTVSHSHSLKRLMERSKKWMPKGKRMNRSETSVRKVRKTVSKEQVIWRAKELAHRQAVKVGNFPPSL